MLRLGVIGSGFGVIGLAPAFAGIPECKVVAVCTDKSEWRSFLENNDLDAVALAVPPNAQFEVAMSAIDKGLHVFAEKPMTANLVQAQELVALAEKKGITHGIDFIFQEIAEWQKVKELLDTKVFGELQHISVNWDFLGGDIKNKKSSWKTSTQEGGGAVSFYFSHGFYYLEHLVGKISNTRSLLVSSDSSMNGGEVNVDMLLEFENGVTGYAHISSSSHGLVRHRLEFQCENGVIVLENRNAVVDGFTVTTLSEDGEKIIEVDKDVTEENDDERVKIVRKNAKRFVESCLNHTQMTPSFKDGLRVQELIEKVRSTSI